jgi:ketosteroid isomerase-like protein
MDHTPNERPGADTETASPQAQLALRVIRAVEQRDRKTLFALLHDDVEFHEAPSLPYGGSSSGKHTMREHLERAPETTWLGTWEPLQPTQRERQMNPRVVAHRGDDVVVEYRQRGVGATGERFDAPVLALYQVRDGRLARAQMFHFDTAAIGRFLKAVGASGR